ncbi:hypothetical protein SLEP1_g53490 [Rubroshorea leprosula]|uniref:Uncharacterized protein n=1 Tax=Rubroshorea leprosula TaxID=152421 RepID=A0AAV5MBX7_9ROSI|nr:hypothetical protein SLEP1_g53490 [Rubroshorea leprosula]
MAMGKILSRLILDDPLIPLLNRGEQPAAVVATRNSPALTLLHDLKPGRFLDDLLENPSKSWNEVNDRSASFILSEDLQSSKWRVDDKQSKEHKQLEAREKKKKQKIQHWVKRPPPQTHEYPRADKSKYCDFHQGYGHNTDDCQSLKDKNIPNLKDRDKDINSAATKIITSGIPLLSGTSNMISGDMHSGGQSTRAREEPNIVMPYANPFVATMHIGNHNVNKVFIDTSSSPDILYWSCFQKMQLNSASMQRYEGPIYGFNNQPVPVKGVITLPIYVGTEPRFRMASVSFLVVKMESAYNAIIGRATLCKLKAVISQPHLCMKFPTPQGIRMLKGNQKMARAYYHDTFKKVEPAPMPKLLLWLLDQTNQVCRR